MNFPNRRSIRLKDYDYSQEGFYFVTLVTAKRVPILAEIQSGEALLSPLGEIVYEEWFRSTEIRKELVLYPDEFVIMPNHIHGIVRIVGAIGRSQSAGAQGLAPLQRKPKSLGSFIAGFKSAATKRIIEFRGTPRKPVWQRNYYEHIIRNDQALANIRNYIEANPLQWERDRENPTFQGQDHHHRWPTARF